MWAPGELSPEDLAFNARYAEVQARLLAGESLQDCAREELAAMEAISPKAQVAQANGAPAFPEAETPTSPTSSPASPTTPSGLAKERTALMKSFRTGELDKVVDKMEETDSAELEDSEELKKRLVLIQMLDKYELERLSQFSDREKERARERDLSV